MIWFLQSMHWYAMIKIWLLTNVFTGEAFNLQVLAQKSLVCSHERHSIWKSWLRILDWISLIEKNFKTLLEWCILEDHSLYKSRFIIFIHEYPQLWINRSSLLYFKLKINFLLTKSTAVRIWRRNSEPIKRFPFGNSSDFWSHLRFDFRDSVSTSGLSGPLGGPLLCSISACVGNRWENPGKLKKLSTQWGEAANTKWRWYSHPPWRRKYLIKSSSAKISRRIFSEGSLDSSCKESPLKRDRHYYLEWALIQRWF